ncbi:MAG: NAD(P)/FAD-dependent oxidoreductase [Thermomicrobiales bacterium]|nr:NAD(P)/FAD-dependent oxidoreductase [Thermomicrobiales bacterium]
MSSAPNGAVPARPRVVIIGGGFAGLNAARALRRSPVDITLIDRRNHHLFQPLLYQVATAALAPSEIAQPIRRLLRGQKNARVVMGEVIGIDLDARRVETAQGRIPFDYLIVAAGASHSYFGNDQWEPYAPGLKSIEDALDIRSRILGSFEEAEKTEDAAAREAWLTFVVVGAGPTGVELAGAIAETARQTMVDDFTRIDPRTARVILVEALPRVLPPFPEDLAAKAQRQLEELGVETRYGKPVTHIEPGLVRIGDVDVPCQTVFWAAGVKASPLGKQLGVETDRAGRVPVQDDLTVPGHPNVLVAGDLASLKIGGKPVPGVAPAAIQMGRHAGHNVDRMARRQPTAPFKFSDKGSMAIVGRNKAVAQINTFKFAGFFAWFAWLAVHLAYLTGVRTRILTVIEWIWGYVTFGRGARLIVVAPPARRAAAPLPAQESAVPTTEMREPVGAGQARGR